MASTLPLKLAVVGAGPSGFYLASRILSLLPFSSHPSVEVHVYDRLWAPHGLVRYGVAPDHPEVKVSYTYTHSLITVE
jgi:adrenodoxin-NADP+ reductase